MHARGGQVNMKLLIWFICCSFIINAFCDEITQITLETADDANTETSYRAGENATVDDLISDLRTIIELAKIREAARKTTIQNLSEEKRHLLDTINQLTVNNSALEANLVASKNENSKFLDELSIASEDLKICKKRLASECNSDDEALDTCESNLRSCNRKYRNCRSNLEESELDKTDLESKLNRCNIALGNCRQTVGDKIATELELESTIYELNKTLQQVQFQLGLCRNSTPTINNPQCIEDLDFQRIEINNCKKNINSLERNISLIDFDLKNCERKISELDISGTDIEILSKNLTDCQRQNIFLNNQARKLEELIKNNEANIKDLAQTIRDLRQKWTSLESDLQSNTRKNSNLQAKITSLTQDVSTISSQLEDQISPRQVQSTQGLEDLKRSGKLVNLQGEWFYFRSNPLVFWAHASSLCHELGMRMVILDSHEKNEKIFNYIKTNSRFAVKHFWIGTIRLTKPNGSYEYLWQNTQKQVSYNSWDNHQPSPQAHEECVEIWGGAHRLAWNNIGCNDINGVICEMIN